MYIIAFVTGVKFPILGLLAGISMIILRSSSLSLYAATKAVEVCSCTTNEATVHCNIGALVYLYEWRGVPASCNTFSNLVNRASVHSL